MSHYRSCLKISAYSVKIKKGNVGDFPKSAMVSITVQNKNVHKIIL